jgi:hypothetical protein
MEWLTFAMVVLVAAAVLTLPGLAVSVAIGLRGLVRWATAAPLSMGIVAVASLWAPFAGMRWSLLPVVLTTAVLAIAAVMLRLLLPGRTQGTADMVCPPRWVTLSALAIGAIIITAQVLMVIGEPGNISQSFDNVFHLNAVRYVLDTGSASPLSVGRMTSLSGGLSFYPSAWHAFVALIVTLTGASIPVATNALVIPAAALAWVASVMLLTRTFFRVDSRVAIAVGVLSAAAASFPLLMIDYGVLYPYFLALTVLPTVVALTLRLLDLGIERPEKSLPLMFSGAIMLCGLAVTHPGALVAWLFVAVVTAAWAWARLLRRGTSRRVKLSWSVVLVAFVSTAFVAWRVLRPPAEARGWPIDRTIPQALGEVLFQGMHGASLAPVLVLTFWTGVVLVWRTGHRAGYLALTFYGMFSVLYLAAAALPWQRLRDLMTAAWYNNSPRLAALIPMFVIPIAALGARHLMTLMVRLARRVGLPQRRRIILMVPVALAALAATQLGGPADEVRLANGAYALDSSSPLLSADEYALLEELPELVPRDAVIAGSPWTGTALAYAISDRDVLMRHLLTEVSSAGAVVNEELSEAGREDPELCAALDASGVTYVLDFGTREVHGATHDFPGLDDLRHSTNVRLVHGIGDARLYEVTACGLSK